MNYIERFMEKRNEIMKQNFDILPPISLEESVEVLDAIAEPIRAGQLSPDSPVWDDVTRYRPECRDQKCQGENHFFNRDLIAGMDLDTFIIYFPKVQYIVSQILDFVYKEEMIVTNLSDELDESKTKTVQSALNLKDPTGISNSRKIYSATKEALLYGRAGLFLRKDGRLVVYPHDRYTVVMGQPKNSETLESEVLGYLVYTENNKANQAVLDLKNFGDFGKTDVNDPAVTGNNDWILEAIGRPNRITNWDDDMLYIPVGINRFVNLRYDTEVQNPLSRLYYSRFEVENSAYFRTAMNRKFLEKGLGRLIIQLKDEVTQAGSNDGSLDALFNTNQNAKKDWLKNIREFTQAFSNTLKNLNDDDFVVSPSNIDNIERLENTNEPNLYMKLLNSDDSILPAVYGVPASLLGLGTLSDRNISIASINSTAEDTSIREIRETFMNQLAILFKIDGDEVLTSEKIIDKETQQEIAKTTAEVAKIMNDIGMTQEAVNYVRENIIQ